MATTAGMLDRDKFTVRAGGRLRTALAVLTMATATHARTVAV
jgi:hypothetical protein